MLRRLGVIVIGLAIGACASSGAPAASTSVSEPDGSTVASILASPSASPSASIFESSRHGYRVEIPSGWNVNEYGGSWEALSEFTPGGEIPGEDVIATPDFGSFLVMNSMPIPPDMTPDAWHSEFQALVSAGLPADCPGTTRSATFAGEPAMIVEQTCAGSSIVGRSLVHAGRGYYFTTLSPYPDPASEAVVETLAASIEFTD